MTVAQKHTVCIWVVDVRDPPGALFASWRMKAANPCLSTDLTTLGRQRVGRHVRGNARAIHDAGSIVQLYSCLHAVMSFDTWNRPYVEVSIVQSYISIPSQPVPKDQTQPKRFRYADAPRNTKICVATNIDRIQFVANLIRSCQPCPVMRRPWA